MYCPVLIVRQLRELARERIKDAEALFNVGRYEGAMYICGYAIEMALKAKFCKTLKWPEFPETNREFNQNEKYKPFKIHTLDLLLSYSGQETKIKTRFLAEWSTVAAWSPESRYTPATRPTRATRARVLSALRTKARDMIDSANVLLREL
jgi:HEPN domain-containing protein